MKNFVDILRALGLLPKLANSGRRSWSRALLVMNEIVSWIESASCGAPIAALVHTRSFSLTILVAVVRVNSQRGSFLRRVTCFTEYFNYGIVFGAASIFDSLVIDEH